MFIDNRKRTPLYSICQSTLDVSTASTVAAQTSAAPTTPEPGRFQNIYVAHHIVRL